MQNKVFVSILLAFLSFGLQAQDFAGGPAGPNSLGLYIGFEHTSVQDQNASPLRYRGKIPRVSLSYTRLTAGGEWQIKLSVRYGKYGAKAYPNRAINRGDWMMPVTGNLIAARFSLNYLRNVHTSANGAIRMGIGIEQLLQYPMEAPNAGLISVTGLPAIVQVQRRLGVKNNFTSQVQYSLAGLVTRLPWHATISLPGVAGEVKALYKNNTRLEGGHRLRQLTWHTRWQHNLSRRFAVGLVYGLERLRYPDPRPLSSWSHSLSAATSLSF